MIVSYTDLRDELATILCTATSPPCDRCTDAANRLVVHRRSVRQLLTRFANQEAGLLDDPTAITPTDLKTMVMQIGDDDA